MGNKKCPKCGHTLVDTISDSSSILKCNNYGYSEVSTIPIGLEWDMKIYKVYLDGQNDVINDQMATVSHLFGINYIETKKRLANGGLVYSRKAIEIVEKVCKLTIAKIQFHIEPKFTYK